MQHFHYIAPMITLNELSLSVTNNWFVYQIEGTVVVKNAMLT